MYHIFALVLLCFVNSVTLQGTGSGANGNLRLCVVEGRGSYKRAPKYCPILDEHKAGVECVIGTDRLDCLRRISKGSVDFGVFSPEDLVAAQWAEVDVLVTNKLKLRSRPFERNVVAVVNRRILPDQSSSLRSIVRNSTLCHPGVGVDDIRPLSDTLSGYLEDLLLERSCDPNLSLTENRIKALAGFFGKACKAGDWVPDPARNAELKRAYPSLCAACGSPSKCSKTDRYWGDSGALACLVEAAGDITWAELDDIKSYFGLSYRNPANSYPSTERFAYLCRDGTWQPLENNTDPCVWVHRPWPVIVAKRKASAAVSEITKRLTDGVMTGNQLWQGALTALLETRQGQAEPLQPPRNPMDYLASAKGFREAYSQTGCDPPRHITFCTTSLLAKNKCEWLSEAGAVYGVVPPLQCIARPDTPACLQAVKDGEADATVADSEWFAAGIRNYSLIPLLYETTPIVDQTSTIVAYVKKASKMSKMADLKGKRAAFPRYDGVAWHAVKQYVQNTEKVNCQEFVKSYFKEICAPGIHNLNLGNNLQDCYEPTEEEALKSLLEGKSDVAFISLETFKTANATSKEDSQIKTLIPICPKESRNFCYIGWANLGHVYAANNVTSRRRHEIVNALTKLDEMFGKHPPFHIPMFSMYGPFNHKLDILFHNNTRMLATETIFKTHPYDKFPLNLERQLLNVTDSECTFSFGAKVTPSLLLILSLVLFVSLKQ